MFEVSHPLWRAASSVALLQASDRDPAGLLNEFERVRWRRLRRSVDREDFVAARVLVRSLLVEFGAAEEAAEIHVMQKCSRCGGPHGRPLVVGYPELHVSWAHSDGRVAAVIGDRPVGIDLEGLNAQVPAFGGLAGSVGEWVRMEALVKAGLADLDGALSLKLDWSVNQQRYRYGDFLVYDSIDELLASHIGVAYRTGP